MVALLLGHKVLLGDGELLEFGVSGNRDHLHAILQRHRDALQVIRGGDEHDVGQIIVEVQIVVTEGVVLFGIQNFEQGGRGIAAEVSGHLVHFVEQEHRVRASCLLE